MVKTHFIKPFSVQCHHARLAPPPPPPPPSCTISKGAFVVFSSNYETVYIFVCADNNYIHWNMAQLQMAEKPLHGGFSIEKGSAILSDHQYRLSQSNVVSIDIGWKVVCECCIM